MRQPEPDDGASINALIQACPPLDENSVYCNLLQCTHFADTCVLAEFNGELAGFISGYLIPASPDTLFIWQVAIAERFRGQGLATRMLNELLSRPACNSVASLETTVTSSNLASNSLFHRFAEKHGAPVKQQPLFEQSRHFTDKHETEHLIQVGPFLQRAKKLTTA